MDLEALRKTLTEKAAGVHISVLSKSDIARIDTWIDSPSYDMNRIISGSLFKGLPEKSFTLVVGPEASFKSSFMAIVLGKAQKEGYTPVILDTEGAWTNEFTVRWGLDPEKALYIYTPWVDEALVVLGKLKSQKIEKIALAIDSVGGFERGKLIEDALKGDVKADQGSLQKDLKRLLKMVVNICKAKKSIGIAGGHLFGNPTQYGEPEQLGGGKYLRHAADIIIALKKTILKDDDKKAWGTGISGVTRKNRFYPPFNEASIEIDYRLGINKYAGLLDIALNAEIIIGKGAGWYTHIRSDKKFQGASKFEDLIQEVPEILEEIEDWIKKTGYSSINVNVAKAEKLLETTIKEGEQEWLQEA